MANFQFTCFSHNLRVKSERSTNVLRIPTGAYFDCLYALLPLHTSPIWRTIANNIINWVWYTQNGCPNETTLHLLLCTGGTFTQVNEIFSILANLFWESQPQQNTICHSKMGNKKKCGIPPPHFIVNHSLTALPYTWKHRVIMTGEKRSY